MGIVEHTMRDGWMYSIVYDGLEYVCIVCSYSLLSSCCVCECIPVRMDCRKSRCLGLGHAFRAIISAHTLLLMLGVDLCACRCEYVCGAGTAGSMLRHRISMYSVLGAFLYAATDVFERRPLMIWSWSVAEENACTAHTQTRCTKRQACIPLEFIFNLRMIDHLLHYIWSKVELIISSFFYNEIDFFHTKIEKWLSFLIKQLVFSCKVFVACFYLR